MDPVKALAAADGSENLLAWRALDVARALLEAARLQQLPHEMWQAESQVARCLQATGDYAAAERFLTDALDWADAIPSVDARVEVLCELSELTCTQAEHAEIDNEAQAETSRQCAREHAGEAVQLAACVADLHWEVKVLLRASEVLERCGDHDEAADIQARAMSLLGPPRADALDVADGLRTPIGRTTSR